MRQLLASIASAVFGAALLLPPALVAAPRRVPIVDLHVDLSYQHNYKQRAFGEGSGEVRAGDLERAGVIGVVLPLFVPKDASPVGPRLVDLENSYIAVFGSLLKTPPYRLPGCTRQQRSVSTWLAFEGADPLAGELDQVPLWVARGTRLFGLVHTTNNRLAGSSGEASGRRLGLSSLGRALVQRIHRYGGIVDVSHASDRATAEIIELSKAHGVPAVASHSNARALAPHPRNLTDAQIRGIADTGGIIGLNLHQRFLAVRGGRAELSDVVRQVRHIQKLVGVGHLALGTDFEGGIRPVPGLEDITKLGRLADELRASGMSEAALDLIFYKNALRVLCPGG